MNGKRNPWEAVNVLPFIDAYRLRAAVKELCLPTTLSPKEAERNTRGQVRNTPSLPPSLPRYAQLRSRAGVWAKVASYADKG